MSLKPVTPEAFKLFHEGSLALARAEAVGMKVNVPHLKATIQKTEEKIRQLTLDLKEDKVYHLWRKCYGEKTKLGSRAQLGDVVFGKLGMKRSAADRLKMKEDELFKPANEAGNFAHLDEPFIKKYFKVEQLKKVKSTYLDGILEHTEPDGFCHPNYNLNTVISYRSSCNDPNAQNQPVREPENAELVRQMYIASNTNYCFGEIDFSGVEVRVSASYNGDPVLIKYIEDKTKDMHRDMAAQCFKVPEGKVSKNARYAAKNMFVFPQFYGDYYINNALAMWEACDKLKLDVEGKPMKEWLAKQGIESLGKCNPAEKPKKGTFEHHIKEVEEDFWGRRFKVYTEWKKKTWSLYQKKGGLNTKTGFRLEGVFNRNAILNYSIQGSAFHCDLWSMVQLDKWLLKNKMRTRIIGEIHDSLLLNIHKKEIQDVVCKAHEIMTQKLLKHYPWIIVPMEIEVEVSPPGGSWFQKKKVEIVHGSST